MQYRHSFHAGNFADVHKHIALLALIASLQRKAKGFALIDTHAGAGQYDLNDADGRLGDESSSGIVQLERSVAEAGGALHPAIQQYLDTIEQLRRARGNKRSFYPGSPLLAATHLRAVDRLICVELQAQIARNLQRGLAQSATDAAATARVIVGDGYQELKGQLPPALRRGLVLLDPPYESPQEEKQLAQALADSLVRFETGVYALWYPIKKQHDADLAVARTIRHFKLPTITLEFCVRTADHTAGLNGSGMLIVNPPWQFDSEAAEWQTQLQGLFGGAATSAVKWLIHE
jgi:23S rRNA (adenine2030-N6)-methyltransferase